MSFDELMRQRRREWARKHRERKGCTVDSLIDILRRAKEPVPKLKLNRYNSVGVDYAIKMGFINYTKDRVNNGSAVLSDKGRELLKYFD